MVLMSYVTPWYLGNDPGHTRAEVADADKMGKVISRARRILLVTGPRVPNGQDVSNPHLSLIRAIPSTSLVVSPVTRPAMSDTEGIEPDAFMNVLEVMDRVRDPDWPGFDGKGRYDLIILMGMDYYYASQMLSLMKHFGHGVETMSLEQKYQPNAGYSFSNLTSALWEEEMVKLTQLLGGDD